MRKRNQNTNRRRSNTDFRKHSGIYGAGFVITIVWILLEGDILVTVNDIVVSNPSSNVDKAGGGLT